MILLKKEGPSGLSFNDWLDVFRKIGCSAAEIKDYSEDFDSYKDIVQLTYLKWICAYYGAVYNNDILFSNNLPSNVIESGRGIGNWRNSKVIFLIDEIQTGTSFCCKDFYTRNKISPFIETIQVEEPIKVGRYGSMLWDFIPRYKRLRPFCSTQKLLKLFYRIFKNINPWNSYITPFKKYWTPNILKSNELLLFEMKELQQVNQKVICFSFNLYDKFIKQMPQQYITETSISYVEYPVYYTNRYHWDSFIEKINEKIRSN